LFAEDVLGYTRGHQPRHAKVYRNFRAEYDRLQQERIAAFKEFRADVETGACRGEGGGESRSLPRFVGFQGLADRKISGVHLPRLSQRPRHTRACRPVIPGLERELELELKP
jgi:hypothetical protein